MKGKITLAVLILLCFLVTLSLAVFNSYVTANSGTPLDLDDTRFKENSTEDMPYSIAKMIEETVILNQTFDDEPVGAVPEGWNITEPQHGNFTVDDSVWYGDKPQGNSGMFVDNSTEGSPSPFRSFPPQNGTIVVTFVIRPAFNAGNHTNLIVCSDDGNSAGSNICFSNRSTIEYRDDDGSHILCTYSAETWYRIKMIMNIPNNLYDIFINDRLEAEGANFTKFGVAHEVHRILFGETLSLQPIGHIDNILIRTDIRVQEDYPTIQKAIDAASPENTVSVTASSRPYCENIHFQNKHNLRLIGENRNITIIDGRFEADHNVVSIDTESSNITVSGFTIKNGDKGGISLRGSNNTITDNIISLNRGQGIHVEGKNNYIIGNIISNNEIGVNCFAIEGNIFYHNRFLCNARQVFDFGSNAWDNDAEGNYWSDYVGSDDDKDGIGDTPYIIEYDSRDNYPLFLIQKISQSPEEPSYGESVDVTVITMEDVRVEEAIVCFKNDSEWQEIPMSKIDDKWKATIPPQSYDRRVEYRVNASNICAVWVTSAKFSYRVTDKVKPEIKKVEWKPEKPSENDTVNINATVIEPKYASGVDRVLLVFNVDNGPWLNIAMDYDDASECGHATIGKLPSGVRVVFYIEAYDKAGNSKKDEKKNYTVKSLPAPPTLKVDKEILDFIVERGGTASDKFVIENTGECILNWNITIEEDNQWLKVDGQQNKGGSTKPGKSASIKVTVNTTGLDRGRYKGKLLVSSNGGSEYVHVRMTVNEIIIDRSWVSNAHCDVNSTQAVCFHAVWSNNASAVQKGKIYINETDYGETNSTGWISFSNGSSTAIKRIWTVTGVNCGGTTSYTQTAPNPYIIWDGIKITSGGVYETQAYVTETVTVWFKAGYMYDGTIFDGTKGILFVNGSAMTWSNDRWEIAYSFDTPGNRTFQVSGILDSQHALTFVDDRVGPVSIMWASPILSFIQLEWWMWTIIWTVVASVIVSQFLLLVKRKREGR